MSDINIQGGGPVALVKSPSSIDNKKNISISTGQSIAPSTSGNASPSGQANPAEARQKSNASSQKGQDPLEKAAQRLQKLIDETQDVQQENVKLEINLDEDSGRFVYQSINRDSGEIIKQFPPEDLLDILSKFREIEGLAVDDNA